MKKVKSFIVVVLCLGMIFSLASCASASSSKAKTNEDITICVFMPNAGDPYYQNKAYGYTLGAMILEASHPGLKVNLELFDAGGYEYIEKQVSQIEDALQRDVDAMIITACDGTAIIPTVKKALEKGIPVVNDEAMINYDCTTSISEYSYRVGMNQASATADAMGFEGNIVMLKGPASSSLFADRERGAHDVFKKYSGIKILGEQWNKSNVEDSRRVMEDFISTYGKQIKGVYTGAAVTAIGCVEALKSAGFKPGEVIISTIDLHDEVLSYMKEGWIFGTIPCQPVKLARLSMNAAYDSIHGIKVRPKIYTTDDTVVNLEAYDTFDLSDAEAPSDFSPKLK